MNSTRRIRFLLSLATILFVSATCKPKNFATVQTFESCACNDFDCWERNTASGVAESLKCAKTAGLSAVGMAGLNLLEFSVGLYEIGQSAFDEDWLSLVKAAAGEPDKVNKWVGTQEFRCLSIGGSSVSNFLSLMKVATRVDPNSPEASIIGFVKGILDTIKGALKFGDLVEKCFPSGSAASTPRKVTKALKKMGAVLAVLMVIQDCGLNLADAGFTFGGNTICLLSDIGKLMEQSETLSRMHENNTFGGPANNNDPSECNDTTLSCNYYAMGKWGSFLYNQGDGYFETRAYFCANMCGNSRDGRGTECPKYADRLFGGYPKCAEAACGTNQCMGAIERCMSYCCKQNAGCVEAAAQKLKTYNYNNGSDAAQPKYKVSFPGQPFSGGAITGDNINCNRTSVFDCEATYYGGDNLEFVMPATIRANGRTYQYDGQIECNGQRISKNSDGDSVRFYIQDIDRNYSCSFIFK